MTFEELRRFARGEVLPRDLDDQGRGELEEALLWCIDMGEDVYVRGRIGRTLLGLEVEKEAHVHEWMLCFEGDPGNATAAVCRVCHKRQELPREARDE